jgi:RNA polymerase sigma factor (sigma-70 family)
MTRLPLRSAVQQIRHLVASRSSSEVADAQLLQRFVGHADAGAFRTLVLRHTPLVYGVCQRVLRQDQDAEDAFQATFLILARKAGSIHKQQSLASWLHGVALRTALSARKSLMRRRQHEQRAEERQQPSAVSEAALRELQTLLDQEVQSLPERLRAPFVLCCWEGKSRAEAARELGWKEGTVSSRLAQARLRLQERLGRRGVTLTAALSAVTLVTQPQAGSALAETTAKAVLSVSSAGAGHGISRHTIILAEGVLSAMSKAALKRTLILCAAMLLVSVAIGGVVHATAQPEPAPASRKTVESEAWQGEKTPVKLDDVLAEAAAAIHASAKPSAGVLEEIGAAQVKAGGKAAAQKIFAEVFSLLKKWTEVAEPHQKAIALAILARAQHRSGDEAAATRSFAQATDVGRSCKNDNDRADALQLIARVQAECGDVAQARATARYVEPDFYKGQVLADVAIAQAKAGDVQGAIVQATALSDAFHRALFWLGLATWRADARNDKEAADALRRARQALEQMTEAAHQPSIMVQIALLEGRLDSPAAARKTYEAASALARRERVGLMTSESFLLQLAVVQANRGDRDGSKKTLEEALSALGKDGGPDVVAVRVALGEWRSAHQAIHAAGWDENQKAEQLRRLAEAQAKSGDAAGAYAWATKETEPLVKAMALLGVAYGMLQSRRPR